VIQKYLFGVLALFFLCPGNVPAQIIMIEDVGGKTIACTRSGLSSTLNDCGARGNWYNYVFVGQISKVAAIDNDEKEIQIDPEELFWGEPAASMRVVTSQALCMREFIAGDKWLFYLRKADPIVLDYYANESVPLSEAQDQIETLRRLKRIGDSAILRGRVIQTDSSGLHGTPVPGAQVLAIRLPQNEQFVSVTGPDGSYEFDRLPAGSYKLAARAIGPYQPDDAEIDVAAGSCTDLTLLRSPHALIAGRVTHSDGTPVQNVGVVLVRSDNSWYLTTQTDERGKFIFDSQVPGEYVLGLNYPARTDWFDGAGAGGGLKIPPASLFYPGVEDRANARTIQLTPDEKLDGMDFIVP
jgi:hypothetical protein